MGARRLRRINVAEEPPTQRKTLPTSDIMTKGNTMSTQTFPVTGLTCGHCVGAVTSELNALAGVTDVHIDLVVDGTSTLSVTTDKSSPTSR